MRNRASVLVVLAAVAIATLSTARAAAAPVDVSISFFHQQLAPHGRWVAAASYGNVWIPGGVAAGWEPYVDGEWVNSDYGWTWVADDPWGDIPYHYGTWAWVPPYGWVWIPGTVWAPAWVTWAYTDDYIGWAPVPPSFALSVTGYFGPPIVVSAAHYVCVPARQFVGVRVASVRVPAQQSITIVNRAVKTTRYEVNSGVVRMAGPPQQKIEQAVGRPIPRVSVASLRTRPTSLAAGGVVKAKSVRVVAPEQERARLTVEKAPAKSERSEPKAASRPEAPSRAESVQKQAPAHQVRPESTSSRNAPETRAKPEPRKADVERSPEQPKPKVKPETRAVEPRKESQREHESAQPPRPEPQVQKRSEPKESVSREQTAQKQGAKPKPKPQPQPRELSKEKERPQKESPDSRQER